MSVLAIDEVLLPFFNKTIADCLSSAAHNIKD
jgi:hypothetical protein